MKRLSLISAIFGLGLILCGCGGGSGGSSSSGTTSTSSGSDSNSNSTSASIVTDTTTLSGTVTFPDITAKEVSKTVEATTDTVTVQLYDLNGNLLATADVTSGSSGTYTYKTTAKIVKDAILKAVRGGQTLRAAIDYSAITTGSTKNVDTITTTAVVVIEQNLGITVGSLGTSSAPASPPALSTLSVSTLESDISQAVADAASSSTTSFTSTKAAYANLAAIINAATKSNVDAAQYIAGTVSLTLTVPSYSVSSTGAPVASTLTGDSVKSSITSIASTIKSIGLSSSSSSTSTTSGSITVTW